MPVFNINQNFNRLLKAEDIDGDKKITVDDKGPKRFNLISINGKSFEVCGTFHLSILLQELYLAKKDGKDELDISKEMLTQFKSRVNEKRIDFVVSAFTDFKTKEK